MTTVENTEQHHSVGSKINSAPIRLLLGIASYGQKNLAFLKTIIERYQNMPFSADVVVFSESRKDLGGGIEVVVGLPAKNPWTLPFAHKTLFAQRLEDYDLFVYSEDDMDVTEENIRAFLRLTSVLASDEIAGFLRYEINDDETRLLTDVHGNFHWKPESVNRRGDYTVAEFTNEHAGFYILTQSQLRRAIASGGYLRPPYESRYGLPETAATDPYTSCGFRKVVGISHLEDFLIRHMSNLYVNRHGISLTRFEEQVKTLMEIQDSRYPACSLCVTESRFPHGRWSKSYYEPALPEILTLAPPNAKTILSVGCGSGSLEAQLIQRGADVTALPLDSVIGAAASRLGIRVICDSLHRGLRILSGESFDCVIVSNLFHLLPEPWTALSVCARLVANDGTIVIANPNFRYLPVWVKRAIGWGGYRNLRHFSKSGINTFGMSTMARELRRLGFRVRSARWFNRTAPKNWFFLRKCLGRLMMGDWVIQARR